MWSRYQLLAAVPFALVLLASCVSFMMISEDPHQGPATQVIVIFAGLMLPVIVAAVPIVFPRRIVVALAAVVLFAFAFVELVTVGMLYLPGVIAMVIACALWPAGAGTRKWTGLS
jgi:hypothetical protein